MKKQRTEVFCDVCKVESPMDAIVTCEVHSVDLCANHIRKHFDRATCRLVPADREPTEMEKMERLFGK
jgi:hypothetical protein